MNQTYCDDELNIKKYMLIQCAMFVIHYGFGYYMPWWVVWFPTFLFSIFIFVILLVLIIAVIIEIINGSI